MVSFSTPRASPAIFSKYASFQGKVENSCKVYRILSTSCNGFPSITHCLHIGSFRIRKLPKHASTLLAIHSLANTTTLEEAGSAGPFPYLWKCRIVSCCATPGAMTCSIPHHSHIRLQLSIRTRTHSPCSFSLSDRRYTQQRYVAPLVQSQS